MMNILYNTPYEILAILSIIGSCVFVWSFFKMKKENPKDACSRIVILTLIPAMISCTLKTYCRQKNVNGTFAFFCDIFFWISCAGMIIAAVVLLFVSYKRKGAYYERVKSKKSILIFCGIGILVCVILFLFLEYLDRT